MAVSSDRHRVTHLILYGEVAYHADFVCEVELNCLRLHIYFKWQN